MTESMVDLIQILTIGGILSGGVIWVCRSMTAPLKESLDRLNKAIDRIEQTMMDEQRSRLRTETWIQEVEDRSKGNAKRVEAMERQLTLLAQRIDTMDKEVHVLLETKGLR